MDMSWMDAICKVLSESDEAMHYADIAEKIKEDNLRTSFGATPANTVNAQITQSIKYDGENTKFIKVGRGEYLLKDNETINNSDTQNSLEAEDTETIQDSVIHALGMFWQRDLVLWSSNPTLLGRQQVGADPVDFSTQIGVYLLYDGREVMYVGRSIDRPLGRRLYEHTQDRLRGRWDRFSWFGLLDVTEQGNLQDLNIKPSVNTIIATLEALLIEGLEPPQNRKRGDDFNAMEYLQAEDPEIEKRQMQQILSDMQNKLGVR